MLKATTGLNELMTKSRAELLTDFEQSVLRENELYAKQLEQFQTYAAQVQLDQATFDAWRAEIDAAHEARLLELEEREIARLEAERVRNLTHWQQIMEDTQAVQDLMHQSTEQFWQGATDIMADSLAAQITGVQSASGPMLQALGKLIGGIASQWGQLYVLKGIATIAEGGWPPNPVAIASGLKQIGAGIALKTLGAALGGMAGGGAGGQGRGRGAGLGAAGGLQPVGAAIEGGIPGRDAEGEPFREGKVTIDVTNLGEGQIVTDIPVFITDIVTEINRAAQRDLEIKFITGE
jgi:hypothetical protein